MPHYYDAEAIKTYVSRAIEDGPRGTQSGLARAVGAPQPTINKWKKMQTCPGHEYWPAIEEYFEWKPGTLAGVGGMAPITVTEVQAAIARDAELDSRQRKFLLDAYDMITGRRATTPERPASIPT